MNFYTQSFSQDMALHKKGSIDVVSTFDLKASKKICETLNNPYLGTLTFLEFLPLNV